MCKTPLWFWEIPAGEIVCWTMHGDTLYWVRAEQPQDVRFSDRNRWTRPF